MLRFGGTCISPCCRQTDKQRERKGDKAVVTNNISCVEVNGGTANFLSREIAPSPTPPVTVTVTLIVRRLPQQAVGQAVQ